MTIDLAERKPFSRLTRADFAAFPIWEWADNETGFEAQDESFVRPTAHAIVPTADFAQFLVQASVRLRNGTEMPGCVEVTVQGCRVHCVPTVVFMLDRHLDFVGLESTRLLSRYTKTPDNSPVKWTLSVLLIGEKKTRSGRVRRGIVMRVIELWAMWRLWKAGKK
ncbi:MAG: hypothetical protein ACLGI6_04445 [Gammaproteobacteria bacterium]